MAASEHAEPPELYAIKSGKLRYYPHVGQYRALTSPKRFVTVSAGTQGGKTSFGPIWLYQEMQRRGPGDYIIATPTFPLLNLKLLPEFRRFFEDTLALGTYKQNPTKVFTLSPFGERALFGDTHPDTPTQVFFGHAQDPDSLESATAKAAWLDEAGQKKFKHGSWQALLRRLSIHRGRVLTTSTPYSAFGWFKSELHDRAKAGHPDYDWITFESRMNPAFPTQEWDDAKERLPAWKFDLFYRGRLTRPAGMIYDVWTDEHTIKPFRIPDDWPRFVGQDYGGVNTAAVFLAEDPNTHTLYLYREYLAGGLTIQQHTDALLATEPSIERAVGGARSEEQWRRDFGAAGLKVYAPPVHEVEVGINRAYGLLKSGRLRVFDTCSGFIEEIETYSRKLDENDQPTEQIEDKEKFHRLDAFRYVASYLAGPKQYGAADVL